MKANCVVCNSLFDKVRSAKTCSEACRQVMKRDYQKAYRAEQAAKPDWKQNEVERKKKTLSQPICIECCMPFQRKGNAKTCSVRCSESRSRRLRKSPEMKLYMREYHQVYNSRDDIKARTKMLRSQPHRIEYEHKRNKTPERIEAMREYRKRHQEKPWVRIQVQSKRRSLKWIKYNSDYKKSQSYKDWKRAYNRRPVARERNRIRHQERYRTLEAAKRLGIPSILYTSFKVIDRFTKSQEQNAS